MRLMTFIGWLFVVVAFPGCHYYQEYRQMKGDADIKAERAELMRAYRECVQKYEAAPETQDQHCKGYRSLLDDREGTAR